MTGTPVTDFDRVVRTVCSPNCSAACGVNAFVKNDRVVKLEPAAFPEPGHERICLRGISMATQRIHHPDRLTHPLIREGERGSGNWRKVSWEEAYDYIIERQIRIEGAIEWYDTDAIKVRNGNVRTLIYKTSIKYLYKAGEAQS